MRSNPKKSNMGKVAAVLIILAVLWLVVGTLGMLKIRDLVLNGTYNGSGTQNEEKIEDDEDVSDPLDDQDGIDDPDAGDSGDWDDVLDDDPDDDFDDEDLDDDDYDDDLDDDDEELDDDDADTFTVDAWDGFAAVRTGRGVGYAQVGKIVNGEKVTVTDLKDGWFKIAGGKYKGYYLHESSLR